MKLFTAKSSTKNKEDNQASITRRNFLNAGMAAATFSLATGVTLMAYASNEDKASGKTSRWGLLIDVNKCKSDCNDCVKACSNENGWELSEENSKTDAQWIRKIDLKEMASGREISLPLMCQHCESPPCVDVCPTGASFKRSDGIVLVDKHICIGCRYCMMACPFKARSFIHEEVPEDQKKSWAPRGKGTVESCTMCVHLVDEGGTPACAIACTQTGNEAILFGDLYDPNSEISIRLATYQSSALRDDLMLNPSVRYQNF